MTTTPGTQDIPDPRRVHVGRAPTPTGDVVELDLTGDPQILPRLARAVFRMGLTIAWRRVGALPASDDLHGPALAALQGHPAVRGALRLRLTRAEAEQLVHDIDLALVGRHLTVVAADDHGVPGSEVCS